MARPSAAGCAGLALLSPLLALLLCAKGAQGQACPGPLSAWTLPDGFTAQQYHDGSIPFARSLAISRNSKLNGPVIVYVSSMAADALSFPKASARPNMSVYAMLDMQGRGAADVVFKLVDGAQMGGTPAPNGIALCSGTLYIAAVQPGAWSRLFRIDNVDSIALQKRQVKTSELRLVRDDMPNDATNGWKYIKCDARNLYVSIGANANIALMNGSFTSPSGVLKNITRYSASRSGWVLQAGLFQKNSSTYAYEYASIYRFPLGTTGVTASTAPIKIARGVRSSGGLDFDASGNMYFTDAGRANIGGTNQTVTVDEPDDELNFLRRASSATTATFYGYPYCHTGPAGNNPDYDPYVRDVGVGRGIVDPDTNLQQKALMCNDVSPLPYQAAIQAEGPHFETLGAFLYQDDTYLGQTLQDMGNFPFGNWTNTLFVCAHGTWDRGLLTAGPIGAKVMAHTVHNGVVANYSSFFSGGVPGDNGGLNITDLVDGTNFTGRPVDVVELPDGSLLVSDDFAGRVVRIANCFSHTGTSVGQDSIYGTGRCGTFQRQVTTDSFGLSLKPTSSCTVNLGKSGLKAYSRCQTVDLASPSKIFATIAYNLVQVGPSKTLLIDVAFVVYDYIGVNGNGWVAIGPNAQEMSGAIVAVAKVGATLSGAGATAYNLGQDCVKTTCFTEAPNYFSQGSLKASLAGGAMVIRFLAPVGSNGGGGGGDGGGGGGGGDNAAIHKAASTSMTMVSAMGNLDPLSGYMLQHFLSNQWSFPLDMTVVNVPAPLGAPINPDKITPPAPPATKSNSTLNNNCNTNPCCANGIPYMSCTFTGDAGIPLTHYYTKNQKTSILNVALKGDVSSLGGKSMGWFALGYNQQTPGTMLGTEAVFARYQGPGKADALILRLGGYAVGAFTTVPAASSIYRNVKSIQLPTGELLLTFQINTTLLPSGLLINYAAGSYDGGAGLSGMGVHIMPWGIRGCVTSLGLDPTACPCV